MKRRDFMAATCLAGLAPLGSVAAAASAEGAGKELYDLRLCRLASAEKQEALNAFLGKALIPALNRIGIGPVGVFKMMEGDVADEYLLLPHKSLDSIVGMMAGLSEDGDFFAAGEAFLTAPKSDPAYVRMESSLLLAFDEMPKVEVPSKKDSRLFQLRIYESHSVERGQKKIEMFNGGGEIAIFRDTGLSPVFFGEALIGTKLPNLTYMLGFDDMEANEKAWAAFRGDPRWQRLRTDPAYKDTVSNITNIMLRPADCSQI